MVSLVFVRTPIMDDASKHESRYEVKAVTYHGLNISCDDNTWRATVIFDI